VRVTDCRDPKDNKYLELALAAGAETIVSSDDDLLVLHPWRGVRILRGGLSRRYLIPFSGQICWPADRRLPSQCSQDVLQRMIVPQFVELDIFLEAFQRGVTRELLEAGDVHTLRDAARDRAAPEAMAGKRRRVKPGEAGAVLDDQCDRIGVDRTDTNPIAVGYRLSPCTPRDTRGRQAPDAPEQRACGDRRAASQVSSAATGQRSVRPLGSHSLVPRASWSFLRHGRNSSTPSA
jgi:hypothetical protein